ncbi:MAG: hypothetical protein MR503_09075 [Oscillospiraceae bacterium]|nr:hypothetical protein [Oscillospiraceae bacterium]
MRKIIKYLPAVISAAAVGCCASLCVSAQSDTADTEITPAVTEDISSGWEYSDDGKVYYYDTDGNKLTGLQEIDGKTYYFAPNGAVKNGWFDIDGVRMFFDLDTGENLTGWIDYMDGKFYADPVNGKLTGLQSIDDKLYVFDEYGILQTGWFEYDGSKYFSSEDGVVYTGECEIDGVKYIFSPNGRFQSGWQTIDGLRIFYDYDTAAPLYGWIHYNGLVYYSDAQNGKYTGEHIINGIIYRFTDAGYMATGFQQFEDGTRYYFTDGTIAQGIISDGVNKYYFGDDYLMKTGFITVENDTYYFDSDGKMLYKWQTIDGKTYYFGTDGKMYTGLVRIGAQRYYFNSSGEMQTGIHTIDGSKYYFNVKGIMQYKWQVIRGDTYYFGTDGKMVTGFKVIDSEKYYFAKSGIMQTGLQVIDSKTYLFDSDGKMCYGWYQDGNKKYYFGDKGAALTGWQTIDGNKYYFDSDGVMALGLKTINGQKFYFGDDGILKTGWQIINEKLYYFFSDGAMAVNTMIDGYNFDQNGTPVEFSYVQKRAETILNSIRRNAMSIYNYVKNNNTFYQNETPKTPQQIEAVGWAHLAEHAMNNRNVLSYYFAALQDLLFHQAGFESRIVYGSKDGKDYYWNQIKTDEVWKNYDACGKLSDTTDSYLKLCGYQWYSYIYPKYY